MYTLLLPVQSAKRDWTGSHSTPNNSCIHSLIGDFQNLFDCMRAEKNKDFLHFIEFSCSMMAAWLSFGISQIHKALGILSEKEETHVIVSRSGVLKFKFVAYQMPQKIFNCDHLLLRHIFNANQNKLTITYHF